MLGARAFEGAVEQFVRDDRRNADLPRVLLPYADGGLRGRAVQQADDGIGVQKITNHRNSSSSSGRCCGSGCSSVAWMKSLSSKPATVSSHAQSSFIGSMIT